MTKFYTYPEPTPHWSLLGKASAGVAVAAAARITPGQVIEQLQRLCGADAADADAGDPIIPGA